MLPASQVHVASPVVTVTVTLIVSDLDRMLLVDPSGLTLPQETHATKQPPAQLHRRWPSTRCWQALLRIVSLRLS